MEKNNLAKTKPNNLQNEHSVLEERKEKKPVQQHRHNLNLFENG